MIAIIPNPVFNRQLFEKLNYDHYGLTDHEKIAKELIDKNPCTITVILDNLDYKLWRRKTYASQTKIELISRYHELIWEAFEDNCGHDQLKLNKIYGKWLKKYKNNDEEIMKKELETKYGKEVIKRFRNVGKNMQPRFKIKYERLYNLPEPLNRVDWRNSFDNIFIWEENGKKYYSRGGSGSSGARERNSAFIFGLSLINAKKSVPSHLFLYNDQNELLFLKSFPSLTVPSLDVGSNYFLSHEEEKRILKKVNFVDWNMWGNLKELTIYQGWYHEKQITKFSVEQNCIHFNDLNH